MTAAEALRNHLRRLPLAAHELADKAKVYQRQAANALKARPVTVGAYLRLAVASGYDPTPELALKSTPPHLGDFDAQLFGMAFKMRRFERNQSQRQYGQAAGLPVSTVCRIERADPVGIDSYIKASRLAQVHLFSYFRRAVPCETPTETHSNPT